MEVTILLNFLLLVGCVYSLGPLYDVESASELFVKFIKNFNKTYKDLQDLLNHYESFKQQLIKINTYNSVTSSSININEYADYTDEEKIQLIKTKTREFQEKSTRKYFPAKGIIDLVYKS